MSFYNLVPSLIITDNYIIIFKMRFPTKRCITQINPMPQTTKKVLSNFLKERKPALILMVFFILYSFNAIAVDTVHVVTHNQLTVVTNPSQGYNLYKAW